MASSAIYSINNERSCLLSFKHLYQTPRDTGKCHPQQCKRLGGMLSAVTAASTNANCENDVVTVQKRANSTFKNCGFQRKAVSR